MNTLITVPQMSVLVPDGEGYDTLKVLRCLGQAPEVKTHILSQVRWPITRFSRYSAKSHYHTSQNDADWIVAIRRVVQQCKIDVVLPATMKGLELISQNREVFLEASAIPPIPELDMLKTAQDKWSFQRFAEGQGLPVVPTLFVAHGKRIVANSSELDSIEYPVLLKPTNEMGGRGIVKIYSPSDFYYSVEHKKILNEGHEYILQSYIPGVDFCLGVFCEEGRILAYTLQRNLISSENYFGYQKVMEFVKDDRIIELGTQIVSAMAWNGIAFIDFRVDERDGTVKLIEVNPRQGRALLGSLAAGVNFPLISCLSAMGITCSNSQRENTRYAHPSAFLHMLTSRVLARPTPVRLKWSESGWRFSISDPLPDIVEAINCARKIKLFRRFRNRRQKDEGSICRNLNMDVIVSEEKEKM
ncbi:MAG: ATP-grasp domain-containing protein [Phycisphaerae bacterium]|nr:ATP-grasp domain-containing protein [Phycisphaerae bacterium]